MHACMRGYSVLAFIYNTNDLETSETVLEGITISALLNHYQDPCVSKPAGLQLRP
jgi:hypothetical protein